MKAVLLAIGSELVSTDRLDTNSLRLTGELHALGVPVLWKACLPDDEALIASAVARALSDAELVVLTGGLGPTADDVTREAVARALGLELIIDAETERRLAERFAKLQLRMPESNRKQAERLAGAALLPNRRGTAPGQRLELDGRTLFLLPGVPAEVEGLLSGELLPWVRARVGDDDAIESTELRVACVPESQVEERVAAVYSEFGREHITILAGAGDVRLRASARGPREARRARLAAMRERLAERLGDAVYACAEDVPLEVVVGRLLAAAGSTLATAESCTGGLVAERLTRVPGSSAYFRGGLIAYADDAKRSLAAVRAETLAAHGAVSIEVALELAAGARRAVDSDLGLGITGIAGPSGGSAEKPVGTVCFALTRAAHEPWSLRLRLPGDRRRVREWASQVGLDLVRRSLSGLPKRWEGAA